MFHFRQFCRAWTEGGRKRKFKAHIPRPRTYCLDIYTTEYMWSSPSVGNNDGRKFFFQELPSLRPFTRKTPHWFTTHKCLRCPQS